MTTSICVYIYCLFYFAQINTTKTQISLKISFQRKLPEFLSEFLWFDQFSQAWWNGSLLENYLNLIGLAQIDQAQPQWIPRRKVNNIQSWNRIILTSAKTQTYQNYKIYGRRDALDLFKVTKKRVKETWESMTRESLMINLNKSLTINLSKSLSSLNYLEPNIYKTY